MLRNCLSIKGFIGSCTNGSYPDFKKKTVTILKGKTAGKHVSPVVGVSSRKIHLKRLEDSGIKDLMDSGARIKNFRAKPA